MGGWGGGGGGGGGVIMKIKVASPESVPIRHNVCFVSLKKLINPYSFHILEFRPKRAYIILLSLHWSKAHYFFLTSIEVTL